MKPTMNLSECDGNAFAILGTAQRICKRNGMLDEWDKIKLEATSGDYDHLVKTMMKYFEVE